MERAVLHYVKTSGRQKLREQLKAGYRANAERDVETATAWFPLEEEAWQTFEKTARKSAKKRVKAERSRSRGEATSTS